MLVERCTFETLENWVGLRQTLWPDATEQEHRAEASAVLEGVGDAIAFIVRNGTEALGFAEAALRRDHVNGCTTSPVAFLEGIYVRPEWRRRGAARLLCAAVEDWGKMRGCAELASDTDLANLASQRMHEALGFVETERVVFYHKRLARR